MISLKRFIAPLNSLNLLGYLTSLTNDLNNNFSIHSRVSVPLIVPAGTSEQELVEGKTICVLRATCPVNGVQITFYGTAEQRTTGSMLESTMTTGTPHTPVIITNLDPVVASRQYVKIVNNSGSAQQVVLELVVLEP